MIREQETNSARYRGAFRTHHDYRWPDHVTDGPPWVHSYVFHSNFSSGISGGEVIVDALRGLGEFSDISGVDIGRLDTFVDSYFEGIHGVRNRNGVSMNEPSNVLRDLMASAWGRYALHLVDPAPSINTLINADADDYVTTGVGWDLFDYNRSAGTAKIRNDASQAFSGQRSFWLDDNSTSLVIWAAQIVAAQPGVSYEARAQAHILSGAGQSLYVHYLDGDLNPIGFNRTFVAPNSGYAQYTTTGIAPAGTEFVRVQLYSASSHISEGYWDDIQLFANGIQLSMSAPDFGDSESLHSTAVDNGEPASSGQAETLTVEQNSPNPFNPVTEIRFSVAHDAAVVVEVFDMTGKKVSTVANEHFAAGVHAVRFDATNLPSGVYLYRVRTEGVVKTGRMVLLK